MHKYRKFILMLIISIIAICPFIVNAKKGTELPTCFMCDEKDKTGYKTEKQIIQKINIITSIFNADGTKRIDPIVLAATVLQKYTVSPSDYEYDENFNEDTFRSYWGGVKNNGGNANGLEAWHRNEYKTDENGNIVKDKSGNPIAIGLWGVDQDQDSQVRAEVEKNDKLDMITTATLVMLDSNNFGPYDEDKYVEALIGDRLVGNTNDEESGMINDWFGAVENYLVCGSYQLFNISSLPWKFVTSFFTNSNLEVGLSVAAATYKNRIVNTQKVCENGFIGGIYGVGNDIQDAEERHNSRRGYAKEIIDYANYYKKYYGKDEAQNTCSVGSTGNYSSWKQGDSKWADISIGNSTVREVGCYITSLSMLVAKSGTKIGTLPDGFNEFNPGSWATSLKENNGFDSSGNFKNSGYEKIAPNMKMGGFISANNSNYAQKLSQELSTKTSDGYQKYAVIQIYHDGNRQHWVAVDSVDNGNVKILDPARDGTTLSENYNDYQVQGYRIIYFTDVTDQTSNGSQGQAQSACAGGSSALLEFLASLEGDGEGMMCNYKGQGEGTGYGAENLNDGAGMTTAFGITKYEVDQANSIGYTTFLSDLNSGCVNKEYLDKLREVSLDPYYQFVDTNFADLNLTSYERDAMASVTYGGYAGAKKLANTIRENGKDSEAVYNCFKTLGCSYSNSAYKYGLAIRRLTEYELFRSGNYNADRPFWLKSYSQIQGLSMKDFMATWPTKRSTHLVE